MNNKISFLFLALVFANSTIAQNKSKIDMYLTKGETYLSDRLQMHWKTHATQQYMRGEAYDHCGGDSAIVPTLQIDGARSHATNYQRPSIDELLPQQEDARGMFLKPRGSDKPEWAALSKTGTIISSINNEITGYALDAAKLYQKTLNSKNKEDRKQAEKYARMAYNILTTYMIGVLYTETAYDLNHGHMQTLYGMQTQEVIHESCLPNLCSTYAILRDSTHFITPKSIIKIGNGAKSGRTITLNLEESLEKAFKKWADQIEANGVPNNNWDLMQARFIFNVGQILKTDKAYSDGKGQEHYFAIVETGKSIRQWSLKTLTEYGYHPGSLPMSEEKVGAVWSECPGYSQVVLGDLAEFVRLYQTQLGRDLRKELPVIVSAAKTNVEYLFPDSMTIGFGDTHPSHLKPEIYKKLGIDISQLHPSRTFAAPYTSWLIQRTGMNPQKSLAFALNGSKGNHMHANGISMELFARGQRLAPDGGIGYTLYSGDDYKEYYSQFPAHNTVCVDGVSSYPVMLSQHAFNIIKNEEIAVDSNRTAQYSIVSFIEPETQSLQERIVVMISNKSDDGEGYFVDIFRSKRNDGKDKFHDYFYHNMGQTSQFLSSDGKILQMSPTTELSFAGGHLYAYSYLFDKKCAPMTQNVIVNYSINNDSITMQQYAIGTENRTVFQCLAPTTEGLSRMKNMPYDIKQQPTLTFVARQYGEAWKHPFVNVFVPGSKDIPSSVKSVEYPEVKILDNSCLSAVAILVKHFDGKQELIVSTDSDKAKVIVLNTAFSGRFNVK